MPFDPCGSKQPVTIPPVNPVITRAAKHIEGTWDIEWTRQSNRKCVKLVRCFHIMV